MENNYAAKKLLLEMGVSPDLSGYHYLAEAITTVRELVLINDVNYKFMVLYMQIAKKFNTTSSRVERAMRHAVETAFSFKNELLHEMFSTLIDESGKVTNSCFVCTLVEHLIMEEN